MDFNDQNKNSALDMAAGMARDFDVEEAADFVAKHGDKDWYENFKLLYGMITHPDYSLNPATWAIIAGALAYVICPVDVIPDFIPVLGWLDDAFVLSTVMASLSVEIDNFRLFLEGRQR